MTLKEQILLEKIENIEEEMSLLELKRKHLLLELQKERANNSKK